MIPIVIMLYGRVEPGDVLESALRREIVAAVRERPGLRVGEIARERGLDRKTVAHHVRLLAKAGLLVERGSGRARFVFANGASASAPRAPPGNGLRALRALDEGHATPAALARALDIPRGSAGSLLCALAREGLAQRGPEGYRLSERARALLPDQGLSSGAGMGAS